MTACSSFSKQVSVDDSSSGKQIDIAVGGTLTVTLDSNLTTGYSWELIETGDIGVLQKTGVNMSPRPTICWEPAGRKSGILKRSKQVKHHSEWFTLNSGRGGKLKVSP
jgi:hypothetical protein